MTNTASIDLMSMILKREHIDIQENVSMFVFMDERLSMTAVNIRFIFKIALIAFPKLDS